MKRIVVCFCLVVVGMCILAETSSAQILFRRIWARKKAEIRAEVYGQVYHRVSNELAAKDRTAAPSPVLEIAEVFQAQPLPTAAKARTKAICSDARHGLRQSWRRR